MKSSKIFHQNFIKISSCAFCEFHHWNHVIIQSWWNSDENQGSWNVDEMLMKFWWNFDEHQGSWNVDDILMNCWWNVDEMLMKLWKTNGHEMLKLWWKPRAMKA